MNASPESKPCFSCEWDLDQGLTRCSLCGVPLAPGQKEAEFAAGMYFGIRQLAGSRAVELRGETSAGQLYSNYGRDVHGAVDIFISADWIALDYCHGISRYVPTWRARALTAASEIVLLPSLEQVTKGWRSELDRWSKLSGELNRPTAPAEQSNLWFGLPKFLASYDEASQTITIRKFTPGDWIGHVRPEFVCCPPGVALRR